MKNFDFKKNFDEGSNGAEDKQLVDKVHLLKKINDLELWVSEILNPKLTNREAEIIAFAYEGDSWKVPISYITREDTDVVTAFNIIEKINHHGFWKMISGALTSKTELFLKDKGPEEKLEIAKKINCNHFWGLVIKGEDIKNFIFALSAEEAVSYPEKMGYNGLWDIVLQNPNLINIK